MAGSLNDKLFGALVTVDPVTGRHALQVSGLGSGDVATPIETSIPVAARVTSVMDTGKVAAPAVGATIATIGPLPSGTWEVEISTYIAGTTVANVEIDNMELRIGGATQEKILNPVPGTAGANGLGKMKFKYDGASTVAVHASAAATAGSIYAANIVATRIN